MSVPTDSLELVKFGREIIKKNKALVKKIGVLRNTVGKEQASRADLEEELTKLKSSVSAADALAAILKESDKSLEDTHAAISSLKEQVAHTDTEKAEPSKLVARVCEDCEQRMVRFNVALFGRNRKLKLTRLLVTEFVSAFDAVIQWLDYEDVRKLRHG